MYMWCNFTYQCTLASIMARWKTKADGYFHFFLFLFFFVNLKSSSYFLQLANRHTKVDLLWKQSGKKWTLEMRRNICIWHLKFDLRIKKCGNIQFFIYWGQCHIFFFLHLCALVCSSILTHTETTSWGLG